MSLKGGIGKHNPNTIAANSAGLGQTWWLVPVVLVGVFFLGTRVKPANK